MFTRPWNRWAGVPIRAAGRLPASAGLCLIALFTFLAHTARADFSGYYSVNKWSLTNADLGLNAGTDGSAATPDNGASIVLTGGNSGSGLFGGRTDLVIQAPIAGTVQFHYVYSSKDLSSNTTAGLGCGSLTGPCDLAGYLLNGTFHPLADDIKQGSGDISFPVSAGDTFGFRVETEDNQGEPGILTISAFSAPVSASTAVNVSSEVTVTGTGLLYSRATKTYTGTVSVKNTGPQAIPGPIQVVFTNLPAGVTLVNASGIAGGSPYLTLPSVSNLAPGQSATASVQFSNPANVAIKYSAVVYSGVF